MLASDIQRFARPVSVEEEYLVVEIQELSESNYAARLCFCAAAGLCAALGACRPDARNRIRSRDSQQSHSRAQRIYDRLRGDRRRLRSCLPRRRPDRAPAGCAPSCVGRSSSRSKHVMRRASWAGSSRPGWRMKPGRRTGARSTRWAWGAAIMCSTSGADLAQSRDAGKFGAGGTYRRRRSILADGRIRGQAQQSAGACGARRNCHGECSFAPICRRRLRQSVVRACPLLLE